MKYVFIEMRIKYNNQFPNDQNKSPNGNLIEIKHEKYWREED